MKTTFHDAAAGLRVRALGHAYGMKTVLDGITLDLAPGQVLALVGPSGCGKTTLLHACAGLLAPQQGDIANGFAQTAVMFQQPRLLPWLDTLDNIALGLKAQGVGSAERRERAGRIGRALELDALALRQFPGELSGGMQSRAALARALVLAPGLLLMDEPFSALDIGLKSQLHRLLLGRQAEHGIAVLMITHDLMEAVRLADTVLVMAASPGRVVYRYEPPGAALARDDALVYRSTASLLQVPVVRSAFGLEAATPAAEAGVRAVSGIHAGARPDADAPAPAGIKGLSSC